MFFLLSFALVLVAVMLLVLGVLSGDGLAMIYVSILCSVAAGVVLHLGTRSKAAKPGVAQAGGGWAPTPGLSEAATMSASVAELPDTSVVAAVGSAGTMATTAMDSPPLDDAGEAFFPIADYDDLTIAEILPLLKELYDDELQVVEAHERSTKERLAVLTAIGDIRLRLASTDGDITFSEMTAMGGAGAEEPVASLTVPSAWENEVIEDEEFEDEEAYDEYEDEGHEEEEEAWDEASGVDSYDDLPVSEIRAMLGRLDEDELYRLRDVEESGRGRSGVLDAIDRELALFEPVPVRRAPARKSTAKKAPARKAPVKKKAPARKSTAKKAPARKAPVKKKAPAKRVVAKKAPARKAPVKKKAPAKRVVAKKTAPRRTTTTARKVSAKKTAARKTPARKATKRR